MMVRQMARLTADTLCVTRTTPIGGRVPRLIGTAVARTSSPSVPL
jgi:hypothetical protein